MESLDALTERLSTYVVVDRVTGPVSARELHAAHPGALRWVQRHQVTTGLLVSVALIGGAVVGTYLVVGR